MEEITGWVRNLVFYLVFLTLVLNLLPAGKYEKYVRLFAGMVLVLVAIRPFTSGFRLDEKVAYYFDVFSYREEAADFEKQLTGMEEKRMEELTGRYEEAAADRVREMAEEAGMEPETVEVTIGKDREEESFGKITDIRILEKEAEEENAENRIRIEPVQPVEQVGKENGKEAGNGTDFPAAASGEAVKAAEKEPEGAKELRRRIAEYYQLEESHVEVQWEHE